MILVAVALLLGSCDAFDDSVLSEDMNVKVEGYLMDGVTELPIKGAIVSGSFGDKKTNSDGYYEINGISMGDYRIEVYAEGYMAKVLTPTFMEKEEDFKGDELSFVLTTNMYKKEEAISTQLVDQVGPMSKPLSGIPYTIVLGNSYKNRFIYGKTDAEGMLTDTIPDDSFSIIVDTVVGDIEYTLATLVVSPRSIVKTYSVTLTDLTITPVFMISTNVVDEEGGSIQNYDPNADITIEFNQAIDPEKSVISLLKYVGGSTYEVNVIKTYSEGNKRLVLSPYEGNLAKGQQYILAMNDAVAASNEKAVYTNNLFFGTYTFDVISSLSTPKVFQLKSPSTISQYTSNIDLQLTIDEKSSNVEVYGRYDTGKEFVKFHTESCDWKDQPNGIIMIYGLNFNGFPFDVTPTSGIFDTGKTFELMIRSYVINNGERIYSEFSEVTTLAKDMEATL